MSMIDTQVLIDGAIPRTSRERCGVLLDYLETLAQDTFPLADGELEQWKNDLLAKSDDYEFWNEMEDEIVNAIDDRLPDHLIVELGLHCPGDVVVAKEGN